MKLFKFQKEGVEEIMREFKKHDRVCLAWYTGSGKTNVFIEVIRRFLAENPAAQIGISAFITNEIREQVLQRLSLFGLESSSARIASGEDYDPSKQIHVFNPQKLYAAPIAAKFDLLIIDEGHHGLTPGSKMLRQIIKRNTTARSKILLVSATPWDTLAQKEFKDCPVLKRPLDQGFADGLITDFEFHAEEAQVEFTEKDFSRAGELTRNSLLKYRQIIKSACIGKVENLIARHGEALGKKVIVICPPGNSGEIARELADRFGGLAWLEASRISGFSTSGNLESFLEDESVKFLFVVKKCQVGFDFPELDSVIDLTMTRGVCLLAQRCGRIARKNGKSKKNYFYVYDKSLGRDRVDWLIYTMLDFCLGNFDGWTTKSSKYRETKVGNRYRFHERSQMISSIIKSLREADSLKSVNKLRYIVATKPPTRWTLDLATRRAGEYVDRTHMWRENPALYKWFRLNAKDEMDRIFPLKLRHGKWNEKTVIAVFKKCKTRKEAHLKFSGALAWTAVNGRKDLCEKHLPASKSRQIWNRDSVEKRLSSIRTWAHIRENYPGMRRWMHNNGGESQWKQRWLKVYQDKRKARAA